jgi:hypothetical protein
MKHQDSAKTVGIIGIILIITAFLMWGLVLPALKSSADQDVIDKATNGPGIRQQSPDTPTGEPPMPRP